MAINEAEGDVDTIPGALAKNFMPTKMRIKNPFRENGAKTLDKATTLACIDTDIDNGTSLSTNAILPLCSTVLWCLQWTSTPLSSTSISATSSPCC